MEALEALTRFYDQNDEDARFDSPHGKVEFLTTLRYIEKYLAPGMRIMEIGAGTGRYAHYFAQKGYPVDALELLPRHIEVFRTKTLPGERVSIRQGNALDLAEFSDDAYGVTLLMGPMYHLFTEAEKKRALSEALRVTRPGGVLFVAYCQSDPSVLLYGFQQGNLDRLLETGLVDPESFATCSRPEEVFVLYRREEVDNLAASLPVRRLHFVGTDMYTLYIPDVVDAMDEAAFALYMKFHAALCERADMTGLSHHALDVLQKEAI